MTVTNETIAWALDWQAEGSDGELRWRQPGQAVALTETPDFLGDYATLPLLLDACKARGWSWYARRDYAGDTYYFRIAPMWVQGCTTTLLEAGWTAYMQAVEEETP